MKPRLWVGLSFLLSACLVSALLTVESRCSKGCDSLASYYVWRGTDLSSISQALNVGISAIMTYNQDKIPNQDSVRSGIRINIPFRCDCIDGSFLGHQVTYQTRTGDTYDKIAKKWYSNLTTVPWLEQFNSYPVTNIPENLPLNVTVNCSCGDATVSKEYGLFITYPLREEDTLKKIATSANLRAELIQRYNRGVNFSQGSGLVYIPGKDISGNYPALASSEGALSGGVIAGVSIGVIVAVLGLAFFAYARIYRKKRVEQAVLLSGSQELPAQTGEEHALIKSSISPGQAGGGLGFTGITVDKSVEFSYEELANATDNFSPAKIIGRGGFGAVYHAELRGQQAAIKKMDMKASKEFLSELKVLTHVHHLNLVRLIGYCAEGSLFLVYEYIENGNLSEHLRGPNRKPLPWSTRVQIALDSARGLEYIHEHTEPVYIHRDIKSANILIDKNFHGKVADFGLTKLTKDGHATLPSKIAGTFGYMPPEYAVGVVSTKVDVYAFGVVLYELISAKEAVVKEIGSVDESKSLVSLFEEVLNQPDPKESIRKLVDPRLGDNCPLDSVQKMAQLAKACTQENDQLRPSMRSIVVALMTLSSTTEDWDVQSFYGNHGLVNLMSGRKKHPSDRYSG